MEHNTVNVSQLEPRMRCSIQLEFTRYSASQFIAHLSRYDSFSNRSSLLLASFFRKNRSSGTTERVFSTQREEEKAIRSNILEKIISSIQICDCIYLYMMYICNLYILMERNTSNNFIQQTKIRQISIDRCAYKTAIFGC